MLDAVMRREITGTGNTDEEKMSLDSCLVA